MAKRPVLVGSILTLNEAQQVERAVRSLQTICERVVVIDSESTDHTRQLAVQAGADVVVHPFTAFSDQRNWALDYITTRFGPEYVLFMDADEWLTEELVVAIRRRIDRGTLNADAYLLHRRVRFDGRDLRWGGFANTWLPRLFRPDAGRWEQRAVNEHVALKPSAKVARLPGHVVNDDVDSWEDYIEKHNRYSTLEAQARLALRTGSATPTTLLEALRQPHLRRRWIRQHVWDRLPGRPAIRFFQIFIAAGGLLDGRPGFRRALFEAWQEMCTDLKTDELTRDGP